MISMADNSVTDPQHAEQIASATWRDERTARQAGVLFVEVKLISNDLGHFRISEIKELVKKHLIRHRTEAQVGTVLDIGGAD